MKIGARVLIAHLVLSVCAWVLGPSNLTSNFAALSYAGYIAFTVLNYPGGAILMATAQPVAEEPFWVRTVTDVGAVAITQVVLLGLVWLIVAIRRRMLPDPTVERDARKSSVRPSS
jgi:hypothetical protein